TSINGEFWSPETQFTPRTSPMIVAPFFKTISPFDLTSSLSCKTIASPDFVVAGFNRPCMASESTLEAVGPSMGCGACCDVRFEARFFETRCAVAGTAVVITIDMAIAAIPKPDLVILTSCAFLPLKKQSSFHVPVNPYRHKQQFP